MFGLQVDCGLLLEPLGFIKVLEWVSGAGNALGLAVCPPAQSLTLCHGCVGPSRSTLVGCLSTLCS